MSITENIKVFITSDGNQIIVEGETLSFNFTHPDEIKGIPWEKIHGIYWNWAETNKIGWYVGDMFNSEYKETPLDDSDFETIVKPFVEQFYAEKDRIEQEQQEIQEEWNKFENRQSRALVQLNEDFETVKERSHIKSSLGFTVDANQTANENVTGLLVTIGDGTVQFCDYHNIFRELTKADLQVLQTEIIANAQSLYQQKWVYRTAIEQCADNEQLDKVVEGIKFTYMDFTPTDEGDTGETTE